MSDLGFTHVALQCLDTDRSVAFYERFGGFKVVHSREDPHTERRVVWISDMMRPFVVVLIEAENVQGRLGPISHLGVACESREEVDRLCAEARAEGITVDGPEDWGYQVGYFAFLHDPDGHILELSYGQEVSDIVSKKAGTDLAPK